MEAILHYFDGKTSKLKIDPKNEFIGSKSYRKLVLHMFLDQLVKKLYIRYG